MNKQVNISQLKTNPTNPRIIRDEKFNKLVKSLKEFPRMLELRPIVVDENMVILGGNMRHKAAQELKMDKVWITQVTDLTEEQKKEFTIKDNASFGEWDWDLLANDWENQSLVDWGVDVWIPEEGVEIDDFFNEPEDETPKPEMQKIILEFTEEEYQFVLDKMTKDKRTPEDIFRAGLV